jgi:hypothetical protein
LDRSWGRRQIELARWALEKSPAARPTAIQFRHALRRAMESSKSARRVSLAIAPIACAPTVEAVVIEHEDSVSWPVVMLWGFSEEGAHKVRANLLSHHIEALTWPF